MRVMFTMVLKWYLFLTALGFLGATAFKKEDLIAGMVMTWLVFLVFAWGVFFRFSDAFLQKLPVMKRPNLSFPSPVLALVAAVLSIYVVFFYTGKTLGDVVSSIMIQQSLYQDYQKYFAESDLMVFSVKKIPAILAAALLKLILIYSFIATLVVNKSSKFKEYLSLFLVVISYLVYSVSRGTSFEMFEVLILVWFSLNLKYLVQQKKRSFFCRSNMLLLLLGILAIWGYSYNIAARHGFRELNACSSSANCSSTLFYELFPSLSNITFKMSSYFTFGIYYISTFIEQLWFASPNNFLLGLLPMGYSTVNVSIGEFVCGEKIDCGACWHPDLANFFQSLGFFGLLFLVFCLGAVCRVLARHILQDRDVCAIIAQYFVVLAMMSLPIGNFIVTSSSNILVLALALLVFFASPTRVTEGLSST